MRCLLAARVALLAAALVLSACATTPTTGTQSTSSAPARVVYAAIGASETYGIGASDRSLQAWPRVFTNEVLPRSAVLYNFGIPGATTAQALHDEVPAALAVHPTLVTVWLNVNDLISGVAAAAYEAELRQLLHALRRGGQARLLVANTPDLAQLPAYRACLPNAPVGGAISDAIKLEGATLVDLNLDGSQITQHPEWISADGFHPSGQGYAVIARQFEDAYRRIS